MHYNTSQELWVLALLCFHFVEQHKEFYPYFSGFLHWLWGNQMIFRMPAKELWIMRVWITCRLCIQNKTKWNKGVCIFSGIHSVIHDDVIKWKHFPCQWLFVRVFFDLRLDKRWYKQSRCRWFDSLWRHCNVRGKICRIKSSQQNEKYVYFHILLIIFSCSK